MILSFSVWLASLSMIISRSLPLIQQNFPFMAEAIFHCIHVPLSFVYSPVSGYLGCLLGPSIVNCAAMNIGVRVSFLITVLWGYMHHSGTAGSYGNFIFSFLRNLHAVLCKGCTNLPSHQQCRKVLFPPHPLRHSLFVDFFDDGHSDGVCWPSVSFLCSWEKCLFLIGLFVFVMLSWKRSTLFKLSWTSLCLSWQLTLRLFCDFSLVLQGCLSHAAPGG